MYPRTPYRSLVCFIHSPVQLNVAFCSLIASTTRNSPTARFSTLQEKFLYIFFQSCGSNGKNELAHAFLRQRETEISPLPHTYVVYIFQLLSFYFASRLFKGTCRMIPTEVKALPECLGLTPYYISPDFVVLYCDSP